MDGMENVCFSMRCVFGGAQDAENEKKRCRPTGLMSSAEAHASIKG